MAAEIAGAAPGAAHCPWVKSDQKERTQAGGSDGGKELRKANVGCAEDFAGKKSFAQERIQPSGSTALWSILRVPLIVWAKQGEMGERQCLHTSDV